MEGFSERCSIVYDSGHGCKNLKTLSPLPLCPSAPPDASRFGCALVGLKGHLLKIFAHEIAGQPEPTYPQKCIIPTHTIKAVIRTRHR